MFLFDINKIIFHEQRSVINPKINSWTLEIEPINELSYKLVEQTVGDHGSQKIEENTGQYICCSSQVRNHQKQAPQDRKKQHLNWKKKE